MASTFSWWLSRNMLRLHCYCRGISSVFLRCSPKERLIAVYECYEYMNAMNVVTWEACFSYMYSDRLWNWFSGRAWENLLTYMGHILFVCSGWSDILIIGICRTWTGSIPGRFTVVKWFLWFIEHLAWLCWMQLASLHIFIQKIRQLNSIIMGKWIMTIKDCLT